MQLVSGRARALASQTKVTRVTVILSVLLAALMNHSESFHVGYSFTQWIILKIFSINIFQNIGQWTFSQWRHWTSASPQSSKCKWKLTLTLSLTARSSDYCFTHTKHSFITCVISGNEVSLNSNARLIRINNGWSIEKLIPEGKFCWFSSLIKNLFTNLHQLNE